MRLLMTLVFAFVLGTPFALADEGKFFADEVESTRAGEGGAGGTSEHSEGESGAHHDPFDNSHKNGTAQLASPAEMRYELTIATMVVFLVLLLLLGKFAWGPIAKGLDAREQNIATMISTAEQNQREAEARLRELEARLAAQAEEARQAISAARREGEIIKEKIVGEAQAAAEAEKNRALDDIRAAKNIALKEIAQKSVNTAFELARSLVHREVRPEEHAQLVSESLSKFGNN